MKKSQGTVDESTCAQYISCVFIVFQITGSDVY